MKPNRVAGLLMLVLCVQMFSCSKQNSRSESRADSPEVHSLLELAAGYSLNAYAATNPAVVASNFQQAVTIWEKAAEQGSDKAQFYLGDCYENGHGVDRDVTNAANWYKKASEQGNPDAQCRLGECYEKGSGVEQNYV